MAHSGGVRYFVCMVHNRWIEVGTWAVARRPCDVRAVAMVIFRARRVTYIRRIGHARGVFHPNNSPVLFYVAYVSLYLFVESISP